MSHIIETYIEDGVIVKIDHDTANPNHPRPGKHLKQPPHTKVRWENNEAVGTLHIHFDTSPFISQKTDFQAAPGKMTNMEELFEADPDPITGGNPSFPYTSKLGAVTVDPEIIIDLSGGGPAVKPKKK